MAGKAAAGAALWLVMLSWGEIWKEEARKSGSDRPPAGQPLIGRLEVWRPCTRARTCTTWCLRARTPTCHSSTAWGASRSATASRTLTLTLIPNPNPNPNQVRLTRPRPHKP